MFMTFTFTSSPKAVTEIRVTIHTKEELDLQNDCCPFKAENQ